MVPLGHGSIPAVHADRLRAAEEAGALAVRLIENPIRPSQIMTAHAVENALRVLLALGGSTNALIHLTAIAGRRRGARSICSALNALSDSTPVLVDLKPTGEGYMEDFHAAGGMPALLWELRDLLHQDPIDVTGVSLGERLAEPAFVDRRYIRARSEPVSPVGGIVALFGSLAPRGAILKRSAATPACSRRKRGRWCSTGWRIWPTGSTTRPGCGGGRHPGAEERRLADPGGHAGGGLSADPVPAGPGRGEGHGAHERLPDVGDGVRHDRAAYYAGGRRRRAAGAGGERRPDPAVGEEPVAGSAGPEAELERRRASWVPPAKPKRGWDRLIADRCCRPMKAAIWRCCGPGDDMVSFAGWCVGFGVSVARERTMSLEEFLAWEERQELRWEFDGLAPRAMTGGTAGALDQRV